MFCRCLSVIFYIYFLFGNTNLSIADVFHESPDVESSTSDSMEEEELYADEIEEYIFQLNEKLLWGEEPESSELISRMKNIADQDIFLAMRSYTDWLLDKVEEYIFRLNGDILFSEEPEKAELMLRMKNIADNGSPLAMRCYADWLLKDNPDHFQYMGMAALFGDFEAIKHVYWSTNEEYNPIREVINQIIVYNTWEKYFLNFKSPRETLTMERLNEKINEWYQIFEQR